MSKIVYLAGPIQGRSDADCIVWREDFTTLWAERGHGVLNPMLRDYRAFEDMEDYILAAQIVTEDLADIFNSDGLIVYFDRPSVGTSMEIVYARAANKPIVVVNASGKVVSPWLLHHSNKIVFFLADAADALEELIND